MTQFKIIHCPTDLSTPDRLHLCKMINEVYSKAEAGLWKESESSEGRTTLEEIDFLVENGKLLIAVLENKIIGSVAIKTLGPELAEFGMLVAAPHLRGIGLGRALVEAAEAWGRSRGCSTMQLELLTPQDWIHPVKNFLHGWYSRIGYVPIKTEDFNIEYSRLSPHLATPCNFTLYHKPL